MDECGINFFIALKSADFAKQPCSSNLLSKICFCASGATQVTDCQPQNDPACDISLVRTPVNVLFTISLNVTREQSGALFWCEAQLDLGPEGPQPPPRIISNHFNLTVYCKLILSFVVSCGDRNITVVIGLV